MGALSLPALLLAQDDPLGNWFNDPFFRVRNGVADCPAPLGPLTRRSASVSEAHYRVERGTSCWLAGQCEKPNAYLYDAQIGQAVADLFASASDFQDTSLWITVQRRFVYIDGCTNGERDVQLDRFVRTVPNVQMVFVDVRHGPGAHVPYQIAPAGGTPPQSANGRAATAPLPAVSPSNASPAAMAPTESAPRAVSPSAGVPTGVTPSDTPPPAVSPSTGAPPAVSPNASGPE